MGQTQMLMVILSVIVVGIATAAGITMFNDNALTSNRDAVAADCQAIIAKSKSWYVKPTAMGGGGNAFTNLTLAAIGVNPNNENGAYQLNVVDANNITVIGTGTEVVNGSTPVSVTVGYNITTNAFTYTDNLTGGGQ